MTLQITPQAARTVNHSIREQLALHHVNYDVLSFPELEEAVATHILPNARVQMLRDMLCVDGEFLLEYCWVDALDNRVGRYANGARLYASPSAEALYWALDGDIEHVDALLDTGSSAIRDDLTRAVHSAAKFTQNAEEFRDTLRKTLRTIFCDSVRSNKYTPKMVALAQRLDEADTLNSVDDKDSFHLRILQDHIGEKLIDDFFDNPSWTNFIQLQQIGLERVVRQRVGNMLDLPVPSISPKLLRAAAIAGIDERGKRVFSTTNMPGDVRPTSDVMDLVYSQDPKDWRLAKSLIKHLDEFTESDEYACAVAWRLCFGLSTQTHNATDYARCVYFGMSEHAIWFARHISEHDTSPALTGSDLDLLTDVLFCDEPAQIYGALRVIDAVRLREVYFQVYGHVTVNGLTHGTLPSAVPHIAQYWGCLEALVRGAITIAKQIKMIVPEMLDIASAPNDHISTFERDTLANQLFYVYQDCAQVVLTSSNPRSRAYQNALELAQRYGLRATYLAEQLHNDARAGLVRRDIVRIAQQQGMHSVVRDAYLSRIDEIVASSDSAQRKTGLQIASMLNLDEYYRDV